MVMASFGGALIYYAYRTGRFAESIAKIQQEITELKMLAQKASDAITKDAVQNEQMGMVFKRLDAIDDRLERFIVAGHVSDRGRGSR